MSSKSKSAPADPPFDPRNGPVQIDLAHPGVAEAYKVANVADHSGNYGVVHRIDEGGIAQVQLRDSTHAHVFVPVESLTTVENRGR